MSIRIIRIAESLPPKMTGIGKPSKYLGLADALPTDGSWAVIEGAKSSEGAAARRHGVEIATRSKVIYARRLPA